MLVVVALTVVASALVATTSTTAAEPPAPGDVRACRTRGEGTRPQQLPTPPGVRIGPLVIWPSVRGRSGRTLDQMWRFAVKAPIVLPARAKVVLAIAPEATGLAAFQSHRRGYVSAVRFEACREREPAFAYRGTVGKYTGFPFAIALTRRSACVPMELWIVGRPAAIRRLVPVGRRAC